MAEDENTRNPVPQANPTTPTILVDGYHGVHYANGVVRLNLIEYVYPDDPTSETRERVVARLAMGLPSLISFHAALEDIIEKLKSDGHFREVETPEEAKDVG